MLTEAGNVKLPDFGMAARVEQTQREKLDQRLDAFFEGRAGLCSFQEIYIDCTGDRRMTGRVEDIDKRRYADAMGRPFYEAVDTTQWANVLGAAIQRSLSHAYRNTSKYDGWKRIVRIADLPDFRTKHVLQIGGYGDLPNVSESAPYLPLTTPSDWNATYAAQKRGGTEVVSLEAIRNDDVSAIRRIPESLAHASKRTLAKFVLDFIRTNPTIYDGIALFHASRGNIGSAALSAASLHARSVTVRKQTELTSADRIGIPPRFLLTPLDLEETGWNLLNQRGTNLDPSFEQTRGYELIPVWYWTDANDWALAADPDDITCIEIGFLDGRQEPELFAQDVPTAGSIFSHDQLTYKIRHIWGGTVSDWRGLDKSVVA